MNNYTVDILTPSKIVAKGIPAESLLVPTVRGQINVLKDHTHIVSKLGTGIVTVFGGEDDPDRYFSVTTGVCKVLDNKVIILANTSEEDHEIDVQRAKEALKHAQEQLQSSLSDEELTKYRRKVERAQLRVQLASYKG
ncbi:MAG: ATP synthase F1 subunit epsilon [Deltaproteobacteria bacterium]|jgi:F-type H+-transporting ATPase subunit epsilon|nr:MAG: ATP synthase F1 subunit epsilon [Deltaproteobacteria bacterium]TNF27948.1 MAG: ATP synthase F1 subunit epsilon [Deltaproteobacteria bacterium]